MEEYQIEIIRNTSFHELTQAQREEMKDWFSTEEEFLDLQHLFVGVQSYKEASEKEQPTRKKELDELFVQVYSNKPSFDWKNFFFPAFRPIILQPGFQLAFGLVFLVGIGYFLSTGISTTSAPMQAKKEKSTVEKQKIKKESQAKETVDTTPTVAENLNALAEQPVSMASVETPYKLYVTDQEDRVEEAVASEDVGFTSSSTMSLSNANKDFYNLSDSKLEEDKTYPSNPMKPLSAQPEILDLLFATY
jgi:hypothetical protein